MRTTITTLIIILMILPLASAATLTCRQVSDTSLSIPQFSTGTVEVKCTASGGTVSNVQITPNSDPSTGLSMVSNQAMSPTIADQSSSTAKWSVTGDSPNTYTLSYTISSSGTNTSTGASTTSVVVPSAAQLVVEYVLPPSIFTPTVDTLDFKITNIGGTIANNIKLSLNDGTLYNYPTTIDAGASASYSWTNETGFNESGTYTTKVYAGSVLHDSESVTVNTASSNSTQSQGWNLISLSRIPTNNSLTSVFSSILSELEVVWKYNASNETWALWSSDRPSILNDFNELDVTTGYWIKTTNSATLTTTGSAHTAKSILLYTGWTLVGYPANINKNVTTGISSISSEVQYIWGYDPTEPIESQKWKLYDSSQPANFNTLTNFTVGKGYWFKTTSDVTWDVDW